MRAGLNKFHRIIDYVPIVSNFKNILDLVVKKTSKAGMRGLLKNTEAKEMSATRVWVDFAHKKSGKKIALLIFVPIISNIALLILNRKKRAKFAEGVKSAPSKSEPEIKGRPTEFFHDKLLRRSNVRMEYSSDVERKAILSARRERKKKYKLASNKNKSGNIPESTPLASSMSKEMRLNWLQLELLDDCYWKMLDELKAIPKEERSSALIYSKIVEFLEQKNTAEEEYNEKAFLKSEAQIEDRLPMFKREDRKRLFQPWKPGEIREFTFEVFSRTAVKPNLKSKWDQLIVSLDSLSRHQPFLDQLEMDLSS